jgi:hypothetical protein
MAKKPKKLSLGKIDQWLRDYVQSHGGILTVKYGVDIVG